MERMLKEYQKKGYIDTYKIYQKNDRLYVRITKTKQFDNMIYSDSELFEFIKRNDTQYIYTITSNSGTRSITRITGCGISGCTDDKYIIDKNDVPNVIEKRINNLAKWCGWKERLA